MIYYLGKIVFKIGKYLATINFINFKFLYDCLYNKLKFISLKLYT